MTPSGALLALPIAVALAGCVAAVPLQPSVVAVPGAGKDSQVFQQDDALCRQPGTDYAQCMIAHGNVMQPAPGAVAYGYPAYSYPAYGYPAYGYAVPGYAYPAYYGPAYVAGPSVAIGIGGGWGWGGGWHGGWGGGWHGGWGERRGGWRR